jgi:hypothetical protein
MAFYAAFPVFSKATYSVLVTAIRCGFKRR